MRKATKEMQRNTTRSTIKQFTAMIVMCMILFAGSMQAKAAGALSIAVSSQNVAVGDTVTVTVYAAGANNEEVTADMTVSYDASVLQYASCSASGAAGGGGSVTAKGTEVDITFKVIGSGTASVSASAPAVSGAGVKIAAAGTAAKTEETHKEETKTETPKSADNSLSGITLSAGTLSPQFAGRTTSYTVNVGADVTDLTVTPKTSNAAATIESITGNTGLKTGSNTVKILVKAENGAEATYTLTVNKSETAAEAPAETPAAEETPASETAGTETDAAAQENATEIAAEDGTETVGTVSRDSFDRLNQDYQNLQENYTSFKSSAKRSVAILIFVAAILLILVINLLMKCHDLNQELDEDFEDDEDEEEPVKVSKKQAKAKKQRRDEEEAEVREEKKTRQEVQKAVEAEKVQKKEMSKTEETAKTEQKAEALAEKMDAEAPEKAQHKKMPKEVTLEEEDFEEDEFEDDPGLIRKGHGLFGKKKKAKTQSDDLDEDDFYEDTVETKTIATPQNTKEEVNSQTAAQNRKKAAEKPEADSTDKEEQEQPAKPVDKKKQKRQDKKHEPETSEEDDDDDIEFLDL